MFVSIWWKYCWACQHGDVGMLYKFSKKKGLINPLMSVFCAVAELCVHIICILGSHKRSSASIAIQVYRCVQTKYWGVCIVCSSLLCFFSSVSFFQKSYVWKPHHGDNPFFCTIQWRFIFFFFPIYTRGNCGLSKDDSLINRITHVNTINHKNYSILSAKAKTTKFPNKCQDIKMLLLF